MGMKTVKNNTRYEVQNVDKEVELARSLWSSLTTTQPPVGFLQASQRAWDAPVMARDLQTLVNNAIKQGCSPCKQSMVARRFLLCRFLSVVFEFATRPLESLAVFAWG